MRIAAALIELTLHEAAGTIKARRSVANAVKARLRQRFNISTAEVGDPDHHQLVCIGAVMVGVSPTHLRHQMEKAIRYVEGLGLAEVVADDISVMRLDEIEVVEDSSGEWVPAAWRS